MNAAAGGDRLPRSVGGLIDFAFGSYAARAPLFLGLALGAFVFQAVFEYVTPAPKLSSPEAVTKLYLLEYASIFVDAYIIAAVAAGVGLYAAGAGVTASRIAGAAVERWLPVVAITMLVQAVANLTSPLSGLGPMPDPPWILLLTAPVMWLLWGVLGLAGPIATIGRKRPAFAVFDGLARAVSLSLVPANFGRLCLLAFFAIIPSLMQAVLYDLMVGHAVQRPIFWANVPVDALTVGPITALQTAFALDFARRAGHPIEGPPQEPR